MTDYRNLGIIHILTDLVVSLGYLPEGADQSRAPQGFVLWAGPPLGAQPMWSAVGIQGRTSHSLSPSALYPLCNTILRLSEQVHTKPSSKTHDPTTMMSCRAVANSCRAAWTIAEQYDPNTACHKGVRSSSSESKISSQWTKCAHLESDHRE